MDEKLVCVKCGRELEGNLKETYITASESVFGFASWLTTRQKTVRCGIHYDAEPIAKLAEKWCIENKLTRPRESVFPNNISMPKEK